MIDLPPSPISQLVGTVKPVPTVSSLPRRRKIVTPLPFLGIEIDTTDNDTLDIAPGITRNLAYMLGRTQSGVRMVSVDDEGRLITSTGSPRARTAAGTSNGIVNALATTQDISPNGFDYFVLAVLASNVVVTVHDDNGVMTDAIPPNVQAVQTGFGANIQFFKYEGRGKRIDMTEIASIGGTYFVWYFNTSPQ